jgi:uncharacterized membrane protein (DUF485 family)
MTTDTRHVPSGESRYLEVEQSSEFGALRSTFRGFVFPTTALFLAWYGLYVLLSAYARGFMNHKVVGNINVGLIFGLLQFASTFLIAWAYTRFAGRRLDPAADHLRHEIEGGTGA